MEAIKFKGYNVTLAENQDEYLSLPVHRADDGTLTSCWKLSWFERMKVAFSGTVFLQVLTFNTPPQPVRILTTKPNLEGGSG